MSIFRRSLLVAAFAFSLCALADDPIFYCGGDQFSEYLGYAYLSDFSSVVSSLHPDYVPSDFNPSVYVSPTDPDSCYLVPISFEDYSSWLSDVPYRPFSDDPAYASSTPSAPPSVGGGGSPSGGGEGEGGFDPVGSFGGLPSFMSGLCSVALGLFGVASAACISFLVFRKVRYSSKRL